MLDFLFGTKQAQQTSTQQVQLPEYMQKAASSLVATAGDVAKENFIPYTGPRLAGFSDLEQQAMAQAQQGRGLGGLRGAQAFTAATAAGMPAAADISTYMNPYMTNVADIAARELTRRSEMQQVANEAQATQAGAFGGSRADIVEAERQRNLQQGLGDIYTQAQARAFDTALKAAQQDRRTQLASGLGMAQTAATADALEASDIQRQLGIGGLQRGMDQSILDLGYQQFVQERDFPKQQLGFYSDILRGVPTGSMTTTVGAAPQQPSLFGQIAGAGIGALGAAGNLGLTWGDITGFFS
tara:strand:- start:13445 stop:14338 length:894 start_codon:yes stop_codon:yes gene_type:complete